MDHGETLLRTGGETGANSADRIFRGVAQDATAADQKGIAAYVIYRRAMLAYARQRYDDASGLVDELQNNYDRSIDRRARALQFMIATKTKDVVAQKRILADWKTPLDEPPVLIGYAQIPEFNYAGSPGSNFGDPLIGGAPTLPDNTDGIRWVDIGYWVRPSGEVGNVELLRPAAADQWSESLLNPVAAQRFAPLAVAPDDPGVYKIQRFSLRRAYGAATHSRIRGRYGALEVVPIDLTREEELEQGAGRR